MTELLWLVLALTAFFAVMLPIHRWLWRYWEDIRLNADRAVALREEATGAAAEIMAAAAEERAEAAPTAAAAEDGAAAVMPCRWFWGLLVATLLLWGVQLWIDRGAGGLQNTAAPAGIVSLELAHDPVAASIILESWQDGKSWPSRRSIRATVGVGMDYLFIIAYVLLFHFLCAWASSKLLRYSTTAAALGSVLGLAQLVAGMCDAGENVALLAMLAHGPTATSGASIANSLSPWSEAAALLAITKFLLIVFGLVYVLAGVRFLYETQHFLKVARTVRFSLGLSILAPLVLLSLPQCLDTLRVLAENITRRPHPGIIAAVCFFLASIFFALVSWYWARVLVYLLEPDAQPSDEPEALEKKGYRFAGTVMPRLCGAIPLFLGTIALLLASGLLGRSIGDTQDQSLIDPRPREQGWLVGMAVLMFVLMLVGLYLLRIRRDWLERRRTQQQARYPLPGVNEGFSQALLHLDPWTRAFMVLSALPGVLFWFIIAFWVPEGMLAARSIGPVAVLLVGLSLLLPVGNFLVYAHAKTRVPFVTILLFAAVVFAANALGDNHPVRLLLDQEGQSNPKTPPPLTTAFEHWLRNREDRRHYKSYPVVLVAAEGGGIRATYEAAVTLAHLQDVLQQQQPPVNFAQHTFLISGVSGGSLGAAVFACLADRYTERQAVRQTTEPGNGPPPWAFVADKVVRGDLLSPPLAGMLSADFVQRFLPFALPPRDGRPYFDRALGLEYALEKAWEEGIEEAEKSFKLANPVAEPVDKRNPMALSIYEKTDRFTQRSVPALCLNTTRAETGDRMVISTLLLRNPGSSAASDRHANILAPTCLTDLLPPVDLRLSTAACLSARFPLITSSGYLSVQRVLPAGGEGQKDVRVLEKQRYVDGGYFEVSGLSTLVDVLAMLRDQKVYDESGAPMLWHPVVITLRFHGTAPAAANGFARTPLIEDSPGRMARRGDGPFPERPRPGSTFDDLLTPLFTFVGTATGHSTVAQRRFIYLMDQKWPGHEGPPPKPVSFDFYKYYQPLPLGWMFSEAAATELKRQIGVCSKELNQQTRRTNSDRCERVKAELKPNKLLGSGASAKPPIRVNRTAEKVGSRN